MNFDQLSPTDQTNRAPTGCVTVATAQIIAYHIYPTAYPWSSILSYASATDKKMSPSAKEEIAGVMMGIARIVLYRFYYPSFIAILGRYNNSDKLGSANTDRVPTALDAYGFTSDGIQVYNDNTIRQSLSSGRPVYVTGFPSSGAGHAWVVEGHKSQFYNVYYRVSRYGQLLSSVSGGTRTSGTQVLCNWGWSGGYDGWFASGVFNPSGQKGYNFSTNIRMIPNIRRK